MQLTGKQATTADHGVVLVYSELKIVEPEVVAGHDPHVSTGWVLGGKTSDGRPQLARQPEGSLWGTDGAALLVVDPAEILRDNPDKVELHVTALVGDSVIMSQAGCWGFSELTTKPFSGKLSEVPGSETADSVRGDVWATPYAGFAALAKRSLPSR